MASISIQASNLLSSCSKRRAVNAAIRIPKLARSVNLSSSSSPKIPTTRDLVLEELNFKDHGALYNSTFTPNSSSTTTSATLQQLYAVLESVADRVEMHKNVGEQRDNWNALLLNNINMITLAASTIAGVASAAATGDGASPNLALKVSSTLLFTAATGMLLAMNKIQPSQLAEEQRKATRLFKQLQFQIETTIAIGNPTEEDVKGSIEKMLAIDKAYPLPLLGGAMIEKFPKKYEAAVWWPERKIKFQREEGVDKSHQRNNNTNGWSEELETELKEVVEVVRRNDVEDYERLGSKALKMHKALAIAGPLLTGIAAVGSTFVGSSSWAGVVAALAGSMAATVNAFEHGGQVGMVFEMYRNCGGFFKLLEETVEATLQESELERRENGEIFEIKMALQLGRSVSQLRQLASKSAACRTEGIAVDEFASKLF